MRSEDLVIGKSEGDRTHGAQSMLRFVRGISNFLRKRRWGKNDLANIGLSRSAEDQIEMEFIREFFSENNFHR